MDDLSPLSPWRQKAAERRVRFRRWWYRTADRRRMAVNSFKLVGRQGLTLAISLLGAILVAYGVGMIHRPAGLIVGGMLLWVLQWNYGGRKGSDG